VPPASNKIENHWDGISQEAAVIAIPNEITTAIEGEKMNEKKKTVDMTKPIDRKIEEDLYSKINAITETSAPIAPVTIRQAGNSVEVFLSLMFIHDSPSLIDTKIIRLILGLINGNYYKRKERLWKL
jgi:hypothetical protein